VCGEAAHSQNATSSSIFGSILNKKISMDSSLYVPGAKGFEVLWICHEAVIMGKGVWDKRQGRKNNMVR
jgi:hypothetical protein